MIYNWFVVKNLLLIGSGQLGSRYIQGVIRDTVNYNITVVDSSKLSLNKAKKIWTNNDIQRARNTNF